MIDRDLRQTPGADVRAYYRAAGGAIGGDWYDVFTLADGCLLIIVGDVIGHGLAASIAMRDTRNAILGAALNEREPGHVLTVANRRMLEPAGSQPLATVIYALLDPAKRELRYASAGHPPPIVVDDASSARLYEHADLPLGVELHRYPTRSCRLPAQASLVLYTDGLTEFARNPLEGERALMACAAGTEFVAADNAAAALVREVVGEAPQLDDIAVVTVKLQAMPAKSARLSANDAVA